MLEISVLRGVNVVVSYDAPSFKNLPDKTNGLVGVPKKVLIDNTKIDLNLSEEEKDKINLAFYDEITRRTYYVKRKLTKNIRLLVEIFLSRSVIHDISDESYYKAYYFVAGDKVYYMSEATGLLKVSRPYSTNNARQIKLLMFTQRDYLFTTVNDNPIYYHMLLLILNNDNGESMYKYLSSNEYVINHTVENVYKSPSGRLVVRQDRETDRYARYIEVITSRENILHGNIINDYNLYGIELRCSDVDVVKLNSMLKACDESVSHAEKRNIILGVINGTIEIKVG